ncbi:MAG: IS1634 family transposase [Ardenticatenaceae bacterium]|nr:IS1634 family transposase [Ardenticatenaceae bacterium]
MDEIKAIETERVDDIPLLVAQMERMGLPGLVDAHLRVHGKRQGLSVGWVTAIWLAHILSEADHRLNQVEEWAARRVETLRACVPEAVTVKDLTDDRLADVLRLLSKDANWQALEGALNRDLLRVYDLRPQRVHVDSTSASGYWRVTEDGLFQFGHSKDGRDDQPQVKVMLAVLDPLGLAVATDVVSGPRADDPLYLPIIRRVRQSLEQTGLLYVGDCKMAALETRASVAHEGDFYLCPLSALQMSPAVLRRHLDMAFQTAALQPVERVGLDGAVAVIAEGVEWTERLEAVVGDQPVVWQERRLLVRSLAQARAAEAAVRARLAEAQAALTSLVTPGRGKRRFTTRADLEEATQAILARYDVRGLIDLTFIHQARTRTVRAYRDRPARHFLETTITLTHQVNTTTLDQAIRLLGWRVYVTNHPADQLPLAQAVLAYRDEFLVEHSFGRLKGHPLSLSPMYLERDDHATGLVRLLSLALRVLTLLEFLVRRELAKTADTLAGLYAGNPKRATARPTAERLLEAFRNITLTILHLPHQILYHLTSLSTLQQLILTLLGLDSSVYSRLSRVSLIPP